ncbi:hypothetical protein GQF42_23770 [Streptomyces broussonetiae]|uniref:Uncharacterized protein n=1 Tax=Streptomyces broussonetiae TaxID=2686304 RepID=A0A6I6N5H3_9ACTN|nr:hypothetical protein GQF42_23770 [Streptomyces broussonetiae]
MFSLSRLTRQGALEAMLINEELAKHGVLLVSVEEPYLDTSPHGRRDLRPYRCAGPARLHDQQKWKGDLGCRPLMSRAPRVRSVVPHAPGRTTGHLTADTDGPHLVDCTGAVHLTTVGGGFLDRPPRQTLDFPGSVP